MQRLNNLPREKKGFPRPYHAPQVMDLGTLVNLTQSSPVLDKYNDGGQLPNIYASTPLP
jgi:hypothetical protein